MLLTFAHSPKAVIPAKAGIQLSFCGSEAQDWTPPYTGVANCILHSVISSKD
jgi:hypothetical protein